MVSAGSPASAPVGESTRPLNSLDAANARIAELEQFTAFLVHDLKSPLVTVSGFTHLLRNYVRRQEIENVLEAADRIDQGARRLTAMLDGLSAYSEIGRSALERTEIDLAGLCEGVLASMQTRLAARGVQVQRPADWPALRADRSRVQTALEHMLRNAIEHGCRDGGGKITITASGEEGKVRIAVQDCGTGIPPESRERVFRLFQRFHAQATGPGVGLAAIRRVAELHGGSAWVEHPEGGGLRVILEIP